jgi:hypothetical protein
MTADEILAGMAAAYAGCRSYRDRALGDQGAQNHGASQGSSPGYQKENAMKIKSKVKAGPQIAT